MADQHATDAFPSGVRRDRDVDQMGLCACCRKVQQPEYGTLRRDHPDPAFFDFEVQPIGHIRQSYALIQIRLIRGSKQNT